MSQSPAYVNIAHAAYSQLEQNSAYHQQQYNVWQAQTAAPPHEAEALANTIRVWPSCMNACGRCVRCTAAEQMDTMCSLHVKQAMVRYHAFMKYKNDIQLRPIAHYLSHTEEGNGAKPFPPDETRCLL